MLSAVLLINNPCLITVGLINIGLFKDTLPAKYLQGITWLFLTKLNCDQMNVDSLKLELQQVLENDVALRKEFNELKRSLSDYRNQLIMRDEDCKRLQVTIDVLNTKLMVMERDNSSYRAELTSFKDLRDSISEQLENKQNEIDARIIEIQELRLELNSIATGYETRMESMQRASENEKEELRTSYELQLQELKSNTHYKEAGIREEFENRISELNMHWADKEQSMIFQHEDETQALREQQQELVESLRQEYAAQLSQLAHTSNEQIQSLVNEHQLLVSALEENSTEKLLHLESNYKSEIETIKSTHTAFINENELAHEAKLSALINEYDEKLSNILIHSNTQNTKLNEELGKVQEELRENRNSMSTLQEDNAIKGATIVKLNEELAQLKNELVTEAQRYATLNADFDIYKQNASLSDDDKISDLNAQICHLTNEMDHMGQLFADATNNQAETEKSLELKNEELALAQSKIAELSSTIKALEAGAFDKNEAMETYKSDLLVTIQDEIHQREVDYQKLLAENSNLITEIESAYLKIEGNEAEVTFLKNELEQLRLQSQAKGEDFKETFASKQFELTNLSNQNEELQSKLNLLTEEHVILQNQIQSSSESTEQLELFRHNNAVLLNENKLLSEEIAILRNTVDGLEQKLIALNETNISYENQINDLKSTAGQSNQDDFIDRLFKQIDHLSEQRMALLEEKDQMASQLLKMNDAIGSLSQQVDNEKIDVTGLNNHRKNVILANNSSGQSEKSQMKEEINNLVREIDKCIALLSA